MRFVTRSLLLCVCGAFFSTLVFGGTNGAVARRSLTKIADYNFIKSVAVRSLMNKFGQTLAVGGFVALAAMTPVDGIAADAKKTGEKVDKLLAGGATTTKIGEVEVKNTASAVGLFSGYTNKDDLFVAGIEDILELRRQLLALKVIGSAKSINTRVDGDEKWGGTEDYSIRGNLSQGFNIPGTEYITPNLVIESGFIQLGRNKRLVDATAGVGFSINGKVYGKSFEINPRVGGGILGIGEWDAMSGEFMDVETDSVTYVGMDLKTPFIPLSEFLGIEAGSILDYVPVVPSSYSEYRGYRDISDDNEIVHNIKTVIDISKQFGVELGYNKVGDQEASKYAIGKFKLVLW